MAIHSTWYDNKRSVILSVHDSQWTWDELLTHNATIITEMLEEVAHPVALVLDIRATAWLPDTEAFVESLIHSCEVFNDYAIDSMIFVVEIDEIGYLLAAALRKYGPKGCQYSFTATVQQACEAVYRNRGIDEYVIKFESRRQNG